VAMAVAVAGSGQTGSQQTAALRAKIVVLCMGFVMLLPESWELAMEHCLPRNHFRLY
jgi:hypothetical protein